MTVVVAEVVRDRRVTPYVAIWRLTRRGEVDIIMALALLAAAQGAHMILAVTIADRLSMVAAGEAMAKLSLSSDDEL